MYLQGSENFGERGRLSLAPASSKNFSTQASLRPARRPILYLMVEGTQQGKFKGESEQRNHAQEIAGLKFQYEVSSPRDIATGQASGRRRHSAIMITKEWGAASPQFFQALVSNEVLKTVVIQFFQPDAQGNEQLMHKITLTNAVVTNIRKYGGRAGESPAEMMLEDISLMFQKIEINNMQAKTSVTDQWLNGFPYFIDP